MQTTAQFALTLLLFGAASGLPTGFAQGMGQSTAGPTAAVQPTVEQPLAGQIEALLAEPGAARSHWGIAVTTLQGALIYGHNEGKLFRPASNNKIFTTATAMALLGPEKTFTTRVFGEFDAATGVVTGDLELVGGGDANFAADDLPYRASGSGKRALSPPALADLASLADQVAARGVKRINGDVVGDDTLYPYQPYAESWAQDDQIWGYGAPVSALTIDNNQLKLIVTPRKRLTAGGGAEANAASVQLEQNVPYYTVEAQVYTVAAGAKAEGVQIERLPGSRLVRVFGSMQAGAPADVEEIAIADPAYYAAMVFDAMLRQRGVVIAGGAGVRHRFSSDAIPYLDQWLTPDPCDDRMVAAEPTGAGAAASADGSASCACGSPAASADYGQMLASRTSAPLVEDLVLTNKVSQNLHAELFLHNLGLMAPCGSGSIEDGARLIRANLLHAGLETGEFFFFDGSGLSAHDLVTPSATVRFLSYVARQPWFAQWKASLPDAGEDGTLRERFPDPPVRGHLFAKTGTLGESRALSGFLDTASGRSVIFSIFVDEEAPAGAEDRATLDKIVTAIAEDE
ncbi:MAG: D-alanyl-D-alanine carboxypeptidase/D-alanyl-D-alanine endopeptidase [Acidobacteriaceae bacterium]